MPPSEDPALLGPWCYCCGVGVATPWQQFLPKCWTAWQRGPPPLGYASASSKQSPIIAWRVAHRGCFPTEGANQTNHVWPCAVALQNQQAPLPVHCIKCLFQVKEDPVKGLLLKVGELLCQLCLNNCCPHSTTIMTPMDCIMEQNGIQSLIHDALHHLPYLLQKANATVVPTSLWKQHDNHPGELLRDLSTQPNHLDEADKEAPVIPFPNIVRPLLGVLLQCNAA